MELNVPRIEFQEATPRKLRPTKSIPTLSSSLTPSTTSDHDIFSLNVNTEGSGSSGKSLRRINSTPALTLSAPFAVSDGGIKLKLWDGVGGEGDVLGRMLNWIGDPSIDHVVGPRRAKLLQFTSDQSERLCLTLVASELILIMQLISTS